MSSIQFDISRLVPKFIYSDRNGYALSKAIERAFEYVADAVEAGIALIMDVDTMPEWRLDELAHEYNCLYDYTADIDIKRNWIRNAMPYYSLYGTVAGVLQYLEGRFDSAKVEEWWQYDGDPFHFRIILTGEYSDEAALWAEKAAAATKNVRSVLDYIQFNSVTVAADLNVAASVCGIDITDEIVMV